jgi:hypothetical protein
MQQLKMNRQRFSLGQVVITCGAERIIPPTDVQLALERHHSGDWGEVGPTDWTANDESLKDDGRLLSSYFANNGVKFWIITEANREATTVLLPDEY